MPSPDNPQYADKACLDSQCILWTGAINRTGYGVAHIGQTTTTASRAAWIAAHGPISDDLEIDHLCRNRLCVNVDHLEAVPPRVNYGRSPRVQVTHCPAGHPLSGDNLYVQTQKGYLMRSCRICRNSRSRAS
jgi:hypothetical protein